MFKAVVIADSMGATRLTTMELTYPRCIHAEMLRHRVFSRNTASSRAIPIKKVIQAVRTNPFIPSHWGAAQTGMQALQEITNRSDAQTTWLRARDKAVEYAEVLVELGLHKQVVNRLLEPWTWTTEIITGTQWNNFFMLRCHPDAEPHMQIIAQLMCEAYTASTPVELIPWQWHIPMGGHNYNVEDQLKIATGRLARVSYETHHGVRDVQEDINLHDRLVASNHWSPFEHCAQYVPMAGPGAGGNFGSSWLQYRKTFKGECQ